MGVLIIKSDEEVVQTSSLKGVKLIGTAVTPSCSISLQVAPIDSLAYKLGAFGQNKSTFYSNFFVNRRNAGLLGLIFIEAGK